MKSFYFFILLVGLLPLVSFSQSNFKAGYVVTLKGDTLSGYIDYREWGTNPKSIRFKSTDQKISVLSPEEIRYVEIPNAIAFQRYDGKITTDFINENHLEEGRDTSSKLETVFLKVLQKGPRLTLYEYSDEIKKRYFIKKPDELMPHELIYREYYDINTNQTTGRTVTENAYQKELFQLVLFYNLLDDRIKKDFDNMNYNGPDITNIVSVINGTGDKSRTITYDGGSGGKVLEFYVGAGANITQTNPNAVSAYKQAGGKNYTSTLPALDAGLNIYPNPNTKKVYFGLELAYSENAYKSVYQTTVSPYNTLNYSFNFNALSFAPSINFNVYNAEHVRLFIGGGLIVISNSYSDETFTAVRGASAVPQVNAFLFQTFNTSAIFKAGIRIKSHIELIASYVTAQSISKDNYFELSSNDFKIGFNYNF
jgi:hypothetical protein